MSRSRTVLAAGLVVGTLVLSACGSSDKNAKPSGDVPSFASGSTMEKIAKAGKIRVGTKFDQPGFGFKGLSSSPEGFDVEIAKMVAKEMGVDAKNIEWVETPSKVREEKIEQGAVDMIVATYTINDKRKERVSFAGPYYVAGQQIMVKNDDNTLTGPDSFKANPSAKVCSVTGSTPAEQIKKYLATPDAQLVLFDVYDKCADALRTGQVQGVTTDNVILLGFVSKSEGAFKLVGQQFTQEPYGIGIKKGDKDFCEFINTTLKRKSDDYTKAWTTTAGKVPGSQAPTLPASTPCS